MSGATGLDYAGVRAYLADLDLAADERREIFAAIRAAEHATLSVWAQKAREEKQQQQ